MQLLSVSAVLVPLLTVEGTGVITPACGRVIQTGGAATLAGLRSESLVSQKLLSQKSVRVHGHVKLQRSPKQREAFEKSSPDIVYQHYSG